MSTPNAAARRFSDLADLLPDGTVRLLPQVHPLPGLLGLSPDEVLAAFKHNQARDFTQVIQELEQTENPLRRMLEELRALAAGQPDNPFLRSLLFEPAQLQRLFVELHDHVMGHPVWRHPFFLRMFEGRFDRAQLEQFALHYFNQVKNTRQCVALALGRFSGLMLMPYGVLNERLSEWTQIVLAQLIADEYGVGAHPLEDYPSLAGLFSSRTHIVMYRQLFEGLGLPFATQDVPMLHAVADNVLVQRLVAGHPAFTPLESLASVGLGMEWGVPEFFSLLLGGLIQFAIGNDLPLSQHHLQVFIAHVRYDVLHAIAVLMVTALFSEEENAIQAVKGATNILMAARYGMMSGLYRHVFAQPCEGLDAIKLGAPYRLKDRRIESALREARAGVAADRVVDAASYRQKAETPFVFDEGV